MPEWLSNIVEKSSFFMPHGHCYLWIPSLLWLHVLSDTLIGVAYVGISLLLYVLVRRIRLPFSPVFIAFGLFIGLCGLTHFMSVWTVWNPDYLVDGVVKAATAAASVATAIGLFYIRPQIEEVVHAARLSEERRIRLETTNAELETLYRKVTELDRLKTEFFANVSHELRTPLALVLGPAERLLHDDNLTREQKNQLETISRNGKSLLKQVNDLLDVAKLEAGKMQVRYAELDAAPWFRRIASQFEIAAEQRDVRYRIVVPERLTAQIDPDMVERVLINLLSNAFKFTPQGGEIEAGLRADAGELHLYVQDTGPGVTADQQHAIFDRFHQAEGGATRRYGGTGLGLAIVKDLVELHGGRVDVISSPGSGAKFIVNLPLRAATSAEVRGEPTVHSAAADIALDAALQELSASVATAEDLGLPVHSPDRATVLIVEDNSEMRTFVADTLSGEFNVVTAVDGQEGYERATALRPDLIITDVMMPRMSGDQLVSALRSRQELEAVPILLLSARADDDLRIRLLQTGAQDYLTKPFRPQELRARARNLTAMKRTGDSLRTALTSASKDLEALAQELSIRHRQLQVALTTAEVAKEQAERASAVRSQFLAMVSHELRTPLSTMHTNTQVLARHGQIPDALKHVLSRLNRANQQMSALIEGLLEYTRVESGKVEPQLESLELVTLAKEVVEAHAASASGQVQLQLAPPTKDLPPLMSDPRLLRVVLDNLVSNALKFTNEGTVTVRLAETDGSQVLEVHDTGIGIPAADLPRIFMPFEQLEPVKRKSIPGVGLGLALVKQLVEILQGSVEVQSTPGEGSVFRVSLPIDARRAERVDLRRRMDAV